MKYHDNEFGKRNRERPNFDRPATAHSNVKAWIIAGMAALGLVGIMMWVLDGDGRPTASLNDPNTGAVTQTAPAPPAPATRSQ